MKEGYIDVHVHPIEKLITPQQLIDEMNRSNVQKAVLLALDIDKNVLYEKGIEKRFRTNLANSMVWDIESQYQLALNILDVGRTENTYVAELVRKYPDKFIGFGSINPRRKKKHIKERILRIKELNLKGIKLIPTLQFFDPEKN
ncbi:MAG: amidohydrolase family protein, partial [Candidatus Njordarchaeia archaeon]